MARDELSLVIFMKYINILSTDGHAFISNNIFDVNIQKILMNALVGCRSDIKLLFVNETALYWTVDINYYKLLKPEDRSFSTFPFSSIRTVLKLQLSKFTWQLRRTKKLILL